MLVGEQHCWFKKTITRIHEILPYVCVCALTMALAGCGSSSSSSGGSGSTNPPPNNDKLSMTLSQSSLTVPAGGSVGNVTTTITRTDSTGSISLSVIGLPSGAVASYTQPATGNSGAILLNPGTAAQGTYPLTVSASDGVATATASLSLTINAGLTSQLAAPIQWTSTGPLVSPIPNATHNIVSVKDPSAFYYKNQWNVYSTNAYANGNWGLQYISFADWPDAAAAQPYFMDQNPNFANAYHDSPEVFYFSPTSTWYFLYQSPQPQYSTTTDPTNPASWSAPQNFFASQPATVSNWIDFWIICDSTNCYLFFAGDNGNIYRSQTAKTSFPQGFNTPQIILQDANEFNLFESDKVYALQGTNQYLLTVEALGPGGRFFRAFVTDNLGGQFTPVANADTWATPYAGELNVSFPAPAMDWTNDISHGEMIRVGYDETLTIDPTHLQFLYMGADPAAEAAAANYELIPYKLGLLTRSN